MIVSSRQRACIDRTRRTAVSPSPPREGEHQVQILCGICLADQLLRIRHAVGEDVVDHHDEPTRLKLLVFDDQALPVVPSRVLSLEQRCAASGRARVRSSAHFVWRDSDGASGREPRSCSPTS